MEIAKSFIYAGALATIIQAEGTLWNLGVEDYQVQVPCVANSTPTMDVNGDGSIDRLDCGGWWYGYGYGPTGSEGDYSPKNADGSLILADPADGSPIPGGNLTASGLQVTLSAPAASSADPSGAGVGFDYNQPKGAQDISSQTGFCLTYTLTGSAMQMELAWDEDAYGFDTWHATLPVTSGAASTVDLIWDLSVASTAKISGSWSKDGWGKDDANQPIHTAVEQAYGLKAVLKNGTVTAKSAVLEIQQVGWAGECGVVASSSSAAVSSSSSDASSSSSAAISSSSLMPSSSSVVVSSSSSVTISSSSSVVASALLWSMQSPDYQVQVPCVVNGTAAADNNGDGSIDSYDCAGWWFGYGFGPEGGAVGDYSPKNADGSLELTSPGDGNLTTTGFSIHLSAPAASSSAPAGAGVGFQYNKPEGPVDLSGYSGYCLTYTLTGSPLQVELGWDDDVNGYDTWYAPLALASSATTVNLTWNLSVASTSKTSGSWKKDGWETGTHNQPISTAVDQAWSLRVRLKNTTATAKTAALEIQKIGYAGACGTPVSSSSSSVVGFSSSSLVTPSSSSISIPSSSSVVVPSSSSGVETSSSSSSVVAGCRAPNGATLSAYACQDSDGDGIANWADDDDGDGIANWMDDDDGDGILNWADEDSGLAGAATPVLGAALGRQALDFVKLDSRSVVFQVEEPGLAAVDVFNSTGVRVAQVFRGHASGVVQVSWDGSRFQGGLYYFKLSSGSQVRVTKAVLSR